MKTYHIHINGLVQGVGFRPFVCRLAKKYNITGTVCNTNNGVHIECTAAPNILKAFYNNLLESPPANSIITHHTIKIIAPKIYSSFLIKESKNSNNPDLLLTPDISICNSCSNEVLIAINHRYQYPFTTCLACGPRFSIINKLPYDRINTSMHKLIMCNHCKNEYTDVANNRFFSQTNSCKKCTIPIHLYASENQHLSDSADEILAITDEALHAGKIIAVKGIGGYLLLCDATNETAINTLRFRKKRPAKPFALLYSNEAMASNDVWLNKNEIDALKESSAPIVLSKLKKIKGNKICSNAIAPGLDKVGILLPYTALLLMIIKKFQKPLIATSANISGAPIIYKDTDALKFLFDVADMVLTFERDIVVPQDDSVLQFSTAGQKIILRRGRGLAPNYFPTPFSLNQKCILALGADMKGTFAINDHRHLYVSQYLGNQETIESQNAYKETLNHFTNLLKLSPQQIIIDKHPNYAVSLFGKNLAQTLAVPLIMIQHHQAHFASVLAENQLLTSKEPILGFIWDGTGYGDDEQIWGGEIFLYQHYEMKRIACLDYFPHLLGNKMSKEPRLSALSLLKNFPDKLYLIQQYFSEKEWKFYQSLIQQPATLSTSSMGRFLDAIAVLLELSPFNSYEGQAAMQLEVLARKCASPVKEWYTFIVTDNHIQWQGFFSEFLLDVVNKIDQTVIAVKVFNSLSKLIQNVGDQYGIKKFAFSGGVFQNAFLTDTIIDNLSSNNNLYFHQQLSPNDECIAFGQIAYYYMKQQKEKLNMQLNQYNLIEQN